MKSSFARIILNIGFAVLISAHPASALDDAATGTQRPSRDSPLPYLQPWRNMFAENGALLPPALPGQPPQRLTPASAEAVQRLIDRLPSAPPAEHRVVILPSERLADGAEHAADDRTHPLDAELRAIVQGPLLRAHWSEARRELRELLSQPLPARVEARARFYLGQSFYFSGLYRHATLEFLLAQRLYYAESTPWVHAALAALARES